MKTARGETESFCRIFKEATGRTPIDYLNFYRGECAAELLCSTEIEILDIAFSCGFRDAAYFSRVFRRYKQMSPREYRQRFFIKIKFSGSLPPSQ